ncbi:MAG: site-specific DNA-methyltransferase [Candidatus Melainabacteria bacterium]|nr:MAG: site-specific DNA-methyltransferase [Candidatus Melainabacteria bacterium]
MQKIEALSPETQSVDVVVSNTTLLRGLFPEVFSEGTIDFDLLKELLGENVDEREEKFGLNWPGKRKARLAALTSSTGTLRPCPNESSNWDTTQNLMIEGDNLEVLKLLQKSYHAQVKVIYIDPPYNTGNDFIYPDDYTENLATYLEYTGQVDAEGRKFSNNTESSGRFHSKWLSMMYPRLKLARNLLKDDGVIVCSIDDAEISNLKHIMDEVFGPENQLAVLVWDRNRKNDAKYFSVGHEYMLVYAKNKQRLIELGTIFREPKAGIKEAQELFEQLRKKHNDNWELVQKDWRDFYRAIPESDPRKPLGRFGKLGPRGPYRDDGDISWPGGGGPKYEVLHPKTKKPCKVPAGGWVYSTPEKFQEEVQRGRVVFGPDESTLPRQCRFLFEGDGQVMASVHFSYAQTATMDFVELMGARVFENPKYWDDLRRLVQYFTGPDDIVLDFFAGSGSTGHGVMAQNSNDNGRRRFILVQLPEPLERENKDNKIAIDFCEKLGKPANIAEITKERLRRAAEKITGENPLFVGDVGFRVFKLDSSNIQAWQADRDDVAGSLMRAIEHLSSERSDDDILFELLLKLGLDLTVSIEKKTISGKEVFSIGEGTLLVCLAKKIEAKEVEPLALAIIQWHKELSPTGESVCVFRDSAFANDVAKTNLSSILNQYGLANVRSL